MIRIIKKINLFIIIIILTITLIGCWSRKEPEKLAIITSLIYDIEEDGTYVIYQEILDASAINSDSNDDKKSTYIIKSKGKTVSESVTNGIDLIERNIYGGSNKVRFLTERMAKINLSSYMDFFLRDHLADERPYIVVLKDIDDPLKIYDSDIGLSKMVGAYIETMAELELNTSSVFITSLDFVKAYYSEGQQPVAGVVSVIENETVPENDENQQSESGEMQKNKLILDGLAIFKDNSLIGFLEREDTQIFNLIMNKIQTTYIVVESNSGFITSVTKKPKAKFKTSFENNKVVIDISIKNDIMIVQNESDLDSSDSKDIQIIENLYNNSLKSKVISTIAKVQKDYKSDIFGFGNHFHIDNPKTWKKIKNNWDDEYFSNADIKVSINTNIKFEGEIKEPFEWGSK